MKLHNGEDCNVSHFLQILRVSLGFLDSICVCTFVSVSECVEGLVVGTNLIGYVYNLLIKENRE